MDIAEIVAFESELSDDEADKIESYLAHKWGLADQLTSGHPYKDRPAIRSPRDLAASHRFNRSGKGKHLLLPHKSGKYRWYGLGGQHRILCIRQHN